MTNFLLSYPHCSLEVPEKLKDKLNISPEDLVRLSDVGTDKILGGLKGSRVFAKTHLLFGNLNRHISGKHFVTGKSYDEFNGLFPPKNPINGIDIYRNGYELYEEDKKELLDSYYIPYYKSLVDHITSGQFDILIDVHSCDPTSSGNQLGTGKRADIILGNYGDSDGNPQIELGVTFDSELIRGIKKELESNGLSVSLNTPFPGGNITQQFGFGKDIKIPTLQIEVNKGLYLDDNLQKVNRENVERINGILEGIFKNL